MHGGIKENTESLRVCVVSFVRITVIAVFAHEMSLVVVM